MANGVHLGFSFIFGLKALISLEWGWARGGIGFSQWYMGGVVFKSYDKPGGAVAGWYSA